MQKQLVEQEANYVSYKIYLDNSDEKRRLGFKRVPSFDIFSQQLRSLFTLSSDQQQQQQGEGEGSCKADQRIMKIRYIDEEKDFITVSTAQEWKEASTVLESFPIKRIYVSFENDGQKKTVPNYPSLPIVPRCKRGNKNPCCKRGLTLESRLPSVPEQVEQISPSSIEALKEGSLVHLRSKVTGKNLRVKDEGVIDFLGGKGKKATFIVHKGCKIPNSIRLQNLENPKRWLRITEKGDLNAFGKGGIYTEFVLLPPKPHWKREKKNKFLPLCEEGKGPSIDEATTTPTSTPFVCLRFAKMGLQMGSFPDGSVKDPKRVGRGNRAQFLILQKV
jgi:hypothetical protein